MNMVTMVTSIQTFTNCSSEVSNTSSIKYSNVLLSNLKFIKIKLYVQKYIDIDLKIEGILFVGLMVLAIDR